MGENGFREVPVQAAARREAPTAHHRHVASLFEQHRERVYRAAYRVTGNDADAEDVLQSVFLSLLRLENTVVMDEGAGSYLHRAAVNAAVDLLRRRRTARSEPLGDRHETVRDLRPGPAAAHDAEDLRRRLRAALAELSPAQAEIFVLRAFEGYGNLEIARMLGKSWSTVAVTLHRARARLQKRIQGGSQ